MIWKIRIHSEPSCRLANTLQHSLLLLLLWLINKTLHPGRGEKKDTEKKHLRSNEAFLLLYNDIALLIVERAVLADFTEAATSRAKLILCDYVVAFFFFPLPSPASSPLGVFVWKNNTAARHHFQASLRFVRRRGGCCRLCAAAAAAQSLPSVCIGSDLRRRW